MCGWELLYRWLVVDIHLPDSFHVPQQNRQIIDLILEESNQAWRTAGALRCSAPSPRTSVDSSWLLEAYGSYNHAQQSPLVEWKDRPVLIHPCSLWIHGRLMTHGNPKKKPMKQSKWEDLQLQSDHPFVSKDKSSLPFVQKQQLSTNRGGIAFVSKGNIQQAREVVPKEPCALLLDPGDPLAKLPNLSGPFEVIVFDPALNQEYKRQVHLLVIKPEVHFTLPTPAITLTLAAVCEIVLECDARLTSKDVFQSFYDNPLAKFKAQLKEVCPDPIWGHAAIYGYRAVQEHTKEKNDVVHQCLLKVQQKHRVTLLSASGTGDLVVRDFTPKGEQVQDLSIIPRFWADLLKAASSITGYRGIAVTKRGLAPRFATDSLATARELNQQGDDHQSEYGQLGLALGDSCQGQSLCCPPGHQGGMHSNKVLPSCWGLRLDIVI